jgi:hypothetical protein
MEAQLKTMPDDIINLVCEFMPSYLKDIKSLKLDKQGRGYTINLMNSQKLFLRKQARNCIAISIYIHSKSKIDNLNRQGDLPLYPLPISPTTMLRCIDGGRINEIKEPYIGKLETSIDLDGNCILKGRYLEHSSTGKKICNNLKDYYSIAQLDNIAGWYKIKVPSKFKKNKTKYIQYLMKQEF